MKYDTVVVGAGAAGMCAALLLARHGQRVALVERHNRIAPLLRRFRRGGFWCDPGLHYVGGMHPSGPLDVIFRYLGLSERIQAEPLDPDVYDVIRPGDGEPIHFPVGTDRVCEVLIRRYPRSRAAIMQYMDRVKTVHRRTPFLNFDLPSAVPEADSPWFSSETLAEFLLAHDAEPDLVEMLGRYGFLLYGMSGEECPMTLHAMVLGGFFFSAQRFLRGGDEVVDAFSSGLEAHAVDVFCGAQVTGLETDSGRRLRGVRLAGDDVLECTHCVCTIHPYLLADLLSACAVRPAYLTRLRAQENTFGPLAVYVQSDDLPVELQRSNVYSLDGRRERGSDDTRLLVAMSAGAGTEPSTRRGVCLLRPCPIDLARVSQSDRRGASYGLYETRKQAETLRTVELFERLFPRLRGRCSVLDAATPRTFQWYAAAVGGAAYGLKHSAHEWGPVTKTPVSGLYLAGQSILAPGLVGVFISSFLAVCNILGYQTVWDGLRECR